MPSRREFIKIAGATTAAIAATNCGGVPAELPTPPPPPGPAPQPPKSGSLEKIEHIIFTMQENRSFDHYFGKMPEYRRANNIPGEVDGLPADASNPRLDDPSQVIRSFHFRTQCHENMSPQWNETHGAFNLNNPTSNEARMDGFVTIAAKYSIRNKDTENTTDFNGYRAMGYYDWTDLPFYYDIASKFAMSDRMFAAAPTNTLVNRLYFLAASSFGRIKPSYPENRQYAQKTIFDLCEENNVSWRIYVNKRPDELEAFTYYAWFAGFNKHKGNTAKIVPAEQFLTDAASGNLPQVAMIESGTTTGLDEHPLNNVQKGSEYMRRFYIALMQSPLWTKSVMFQTWDEAGGFYDHVPSPVGIVKPDDIEPMREPDPITPGEFVDVAGSFDRYGFRVPFFAVSPWVKKNYVSHVNSDQTSILKFIETRFKLPPLSQRDAAAHDLLDLFDFTQMSYEVPPAIAEQPVNGVCSFPEQTP